jgi:RNA polymerase sigma-70 factor (ECF subfamily)
MSSERDNYKKLKDFFGQEYHSLRAYVNSRVQAGVNSDAEDILQDVALKLFSGADRYSPIDNVAAFVYHSVKNKIIDIMRQHKRITRPEDPNKAEWTGFTELFGEADNSYSEQMKDALKKNILGLKPDYRDIILAIDFEGYTYKELALESGIPEGTLMSRRHRAISLLYKELETIKEENN